MKKAKISALVLFFAAIIFAAASSALADTPTFTATPGYSSTFTPLSTATPSFTPTIYNSSVPSMTFTPLSTATPSFTPTIYNSSVPTMTFTPVQTSTFTSTVTMSLTSTPLVIETATPMPSAVGAITISKSAGVQYVNYGDTVTYTISYNNTSGTAINGYLLYDNLNYFSFNQLEYVSCTGGGVLGSDNIIVWNMGSLPGGAIGSVSVVARVVGTHTTAMHVYNYAGDNTGNLTNSAIWQFTPTATLTVIATAASATITPSSTQTPSFTATTFDSPTPGMTFTMTATITPSFTPASIPDSIDIVSAVSSSGNCYIAGQNLTITINSSVGGSGWGVPNIYAIVVASSGSLDYSNNSGVADDCLWGLSGATGNAPSNTPPWISGALISTSGNVSNYQIIVPVPAVYASSGPKTFYVIVGTDGNILQLGQYAQTGYIQASITLPECSAGTQTVTPFITPSYTATPTATANITPQPTCNMSVTPVFTVQVTYNNGQAAANSVVIDVTSDSDFTVPPSLVVHPYGESASKPAVNLTTVEYSGPPVYYRAIYPEAPGYGDIDSIIVTGTDVCGRIGVSDGKYTKTSITGGRNTRTYHNVINPDRHERVRVVYNIYGPDVAHIRVFSRSGVMVRNICSCVESGSLKQDETEWYGTNGDDRAVASGIYYITIQTSYYTEMVKVAVIR